MGIVWDLEALLNAISGAALLALGVGLLALNARVRVNLWVGAFAAVWGLQIAASNTPVLTTDEGLARAAAALSVPLLLVLAPLLVAAVESVLRTPDRALIAMRWATLATAILGSIVLLARPGWLLGELVVPSGASYQVAWGPLLPILRGLPFTIAYVVALQALLRARSTCGHRHERARVTVFLGALLVYGAYRFPDTVIGITRAGFDAGFVARDIANIGVAVVGLAMIVRFLGELVNERRAALDPAERREVHLLLLAIGVPGAAALLAFAAVPFGGPEIVTLGAFRLLMVGVLVWGAARFELLSLHVDVGRATAAMGAILAPFIVVPLVTPFFTAGGSSGAVVSGIIAAAVAVPAAFVARGLAGEGGSGARGLHGRTLYATALASGEDDVALARLRRRLGIADGDHAQLHASLVEAPTVTVAAARPGDHVLGAYRVERALGETAHGPTLLAHDVLLDRPVVLKPLGALPDDAASRERVLREGRVAARLRHPRVVEVYKVERDGDLLYLVTEFAPGGDLSALLARERTLTWARGAAIVADVLDALAAVHAEGVVHRDVTPGNVFLDAHARGKLGDFGLTMAEGTGDRAGTLITASPEQLTGGEVSAASDLYSAGALLYALLAGRCYVPLEGRPLPQAIALVQSAPPMLPLPRASAAVNAVLARALEKEPRRRFASAAEMRHALLSATGPQGAVPAPVAA